MTFTELMGLCNGNYIEMAGTTAKNQCVDLANAYIKFVLGLPMIEYTNAVDFPSKASPDNYDYIKNSPTNAPVEGDIIVWGGTYGHVAVCISADSNKIISFDENYPTGSPCRVVEHNYTNPQVLGWLHPKNIPQDQQQIIDALRTERDRNWTYFSKVCEAMNVNTNVDVAVAEIQKLVKIEDSLIIKDKQLSDAQSKITDLENKLADLAFKQTELVTANGVLQEKLTDNERLVSEQQTKLGVLKAELDELKQSIGEVKNGWALILSGIKKLFNIG